MHPFLEVARTGIDSVALHPLRSFVCVSAIVAVLLPHLVGQAISEGLKTQAEISARFGSDLTVTGMRHGRSAPLPIAAVEKIRGIDGVADAAPRIVGRIPLGKDREPAIVVGVPAERMTEWAASVEGALPKNGGAHEIVVGSALARRLSLKVGAVVPPFYRNDREGERIARVVGVFRRDAPLWQAHLVLTTFESAASIFDQSGLTTDILVTVRPGYESAVERAIAQQVTYSDPQGGTVRPRVTTREDLLALLPRGAIRLGGAFNLHFVLLFVAAILVLLVASGLGSSERRREIGILKATGWQTDEILLRGLVESLCIAMAAAMSSFLLAWVWLRPLNGWLIAGYFLPGAGIVPDFDVPYRLTPGPALVDFALAFVIVLIGTLYSSWRAATAPPRVAMR